MKKNIDKKKSKDDIKGERPIILKPIAFTWCPNNKYHTSDPAVGYCMAIQTLKYLRLVSKDFVIYPELTLQGNIHFHGKIYIHDAVKWFKNVLPKLKKNGFVKIKTNLNEGWDEYCGKQWDIFKDVLDLANPIDYQYLSKIKKLKDPVTHAKNILDIMPYRYVSDSDE